MIRTDKWHLQTNPASRQMVAATIAEYRQFCRALSVVVMANWPALNASLSFAAAVERLIHPTASNPSPRHRYFSQRFYKFPSYLRRAAIEFVKGQVSSFLTRYDQWQAGDRKHRHSRPPRFSAEAGCYPALYRGQLFKLNDTFGVASLKLWDGREWLWHDIPIRAVRKRHLAGEIKSPMLVLAGGRCHLSVPISVTPQRLPSAGRACAVDVGINSLAVASIVSSDGTVAARRFIRPSADIDRRDKRATLIRRKARKTANLSKGFCRGLYRKARHINEQIAQLASRQLVDFALANQADVIVLENLKHWRPAAGRKRSNLKQKFHLWLHRRLAELITAKFKEAGGAVATVYARGTSAWAFDGSGKVKRDPKQYELATFANGKRYNADLNASYNIGARYWAQKLKLIRRKDEQLPEDKSSTGKPRAPVTLSTLWQRECEAPHRCAA